MPSVHFGAITAAMGENESVLDALLRAGATIPHSCKAGSCGSCMMKAVAGEVPAAARAGLKDSWTSRGYFLPCVCRPASDLDVASVEDEAQVAATIESLTPLSSSVLRVRLVPDGDFDFQSGQYLSLIREGIARSYSIASLPTDGHVELHIRLIPHGRMSGWLSQQAQPGDTVRLQGPSGECFYVSGDTSQPLLLIGTGTGLAPLYGILRDALSNRHCGPIHLFHGALNSSGIYLSDQLQTIAAEHRNVTYTPTLLERDGPVESLVAGYYPQLDGTRGFVCGDPALVRSLKRKMFLAGMAMRDIHADAFLPSASS